nr:restriction endonuclease subunit S [uncultured Acidocella sp.]
MSSKVKSSATTGGESALVPKLRFPEFRNASGWDNKPLSEVLSLVVRERPKPSKPYTGLGLRSHGKGTFLKEEEDPAKNAMDVLFEVKRDDLIVNITFAWEGAIAIAGLSDDGALVSHRFPTYAFKNGKALPEFFRYRIIDKQFVYNLGVISPGGAGRNRVMSKTDFLKLKVWLPDITEQQKIADCLNSADALIAAQGRKVEALRVHKKGLVQQLFPQEGETQPRLRFSEFRGAGEWKENTLASVAKFFKGKGISKADIQADGSRECIRYGELYTRYGEVIDAVYSRTNVSESELFLSKINDVIIPASGETKIDIAKTSCVMRENVALGGDLNVIRTAQNGIFLSYYLNGPKRMDIAKVAQGDTVVHLYPSQLEKLKVRLPSAPEQQRIADCLTSLDDLINAESKKLDTLKTHKKGLMQKLFPQVGETDA